jgi:hypothetical protein
MDTLERQQFRIKILEEVCKALNFDLNKTLERNNAIFEMFPSIDPEDIISGILYLGEKGYLKYHPIHYMGEIMPTMIKLQSRAIDLIEKIQTNMPTENYEKDFSKIALTNFSNIHNSQIIVNSSNAQINISKNEHEEILKYFDDLLRNNVDNIPVKNIIEKTEEEVRKGKATKDYLRGIGSALMSMGISLASNLLTPTVANLLGIIT